MTGPAFYVYAIVFDQDTFGLFASRADADASLRRQIEEGGPAWEGCEVVRWHIDGTPEIAEDESLRSTDPRDAA